MPNWNKNITRLSGPKDQLDKAIKRLKKQKRGAYIQKDSPDAKSVRGYNVTNKDDK